MGLIGMARGLASEFAPHNIRVNVVSPGSIDTRRDNPEWYQGHLPNAAMVMHITPTVVVLALVLNGIAAIPFGYLYWKRGLESAMIAHFCADFAIYVIGVTFLRV